MSGKTVDTEALERANIALQKYIGKVQFGINYLQNAAQDCTDNMGSDVYSQKAVQQLEFCLKDMNSAITKAEEVRQNILRKKREIEDSSRGL